MDLMPLHRGYAPPTNCRPKRPRTLRGSLERALLSALSSSAVACAGSDSPAGLGQASGGSSSGGAVSGASISGGAGGSSPSGGTSTTIGGTLESAGAAGGSGASGPGGAANAGGAADEGGGTDAGGAPSLAPSCTPTVTGSDSAAAPQKLVVPPLAFEGTHVTVVWEKPLTGKAASYNIYVDGETIGSVSKIVYPLGDSNQQLFHDVTGLTPDTCYTFTVRAVDESGAESGDSNAVARMTTPTPTTLSVTDAPYNAAGDGSTMATAAIQAAIDACPLGGKVLFPAEGTYLSGALFLKSDCTYQIDGLLLSSEKAADYQSGNNLRSTEQTRAFASRPQSVTAEASRLLAPATSASLPKATSARSVFA